VFRPDSEVRDQNLTFHHKPTNTLVNTLSTLQKKKKIQIKRQKKKKKKKKKKKEKKKRKENKKKKKFAPIQAAAAEVITC
jgi:hypothetical protein